MKRSKLNLLAMLGIFILMMAAPVGGLARNSAGQLPAPAAQGAAHPIVRTASRSDTSPALHTIRPIPPAAGPLHTMPEESLPNRPGSQPPPSTDPVLQTAVNPAAATVGVSFEGIDNGDGVLPPDTNGAIGPYNYVQTVNLSFAVYDRSGNKLYGPAHINTLWSGFGGPCQTSNDGDPVVLYDHQADRWLVSQFALPNYPFGPFYQCIAVSVTGDPTGAWYRYEFTISNSKMNDYPKFGVWGDAYYLSVNQFSQASLRWAGEGVAAFERSRLLRGDANARMVYFDLYSVDPNLGGMLPSDLDGQAPPSGAPNTYAQFDDDAWGYSPDQLQLWAFHVDWNNPSNSTFTRTGALATASFDSNMCGGSRNCIPQPGGVNLDAIADRLMYRLQYRNFGSYQTLVVNHTVDVNGQDHAGVRWYELRDNGSGWEVYQQGTYAPDSANRWMASAAMNGVGQIALGYSVSSGSISPSIRFTGRLPGDPSGQMTQGDNHLVDGSGYQEHSSGRWGDYSSLSVDPVDDCTFWYTQEYYNGMSSAGWQTRVGSFQLAGCGTTPPPTEPPPATSIHVASLTGASQNNGKTWTAEVTVAVADNNGSPVGGAAVSGRWDTGLTIGCTTKSDGQCSVSESNIPKKTGTATFTVDTITYSTLPYTPDQNAASSITVSR